jgi:hypothetical protein
MLPDEKLDHTHMDPDLPVASKDVSVLVMNNVVSMKWVTGQAQYFKMATDH